MDARVKRGHDDRGVIGSRAKFLTRSLSKGELGPLCPTRTA